MDEITRMMQSGEMPDTAERLDQITMFLEFIRKKRPHETILGKEKSVGIIEPEHLEAHIRFDKAILTLLNAGQIRTAFNMIYSQVSEFKMTMSIKGKFLEDITKTELRYSQHVYEHRAPTETRRRGVLRRKVKEPVEYVVRD